MKKFCKVVLLLSVLAFVINCQAQSTKSNFKVVNEEITDGVNRPTDDDTTSELPDLAPEELSLTNRNQTFFVNNSTGSASQVIDFNVGNADEPRITREILRDSDQTGVSVKLVLVSYEGGNEALLKRSVTIITNEASENDYWVRYNSTLKSALPQSGNRAKYRVIVYIQDKRTEKKEYSVTERSFDWDFVR